MRSASTSSLTEGRYPPRGDIVRSVSTRARQNSPSLGDKSPQLAASAEPRQNSSRSAAEARQDGRRRQNHGGMAADEGQTAVAERGGIVAEWWRNEGRHRAVREPQREKGRLLETRVSTSPERTALGTTRDAHGAPPRYALGEHCLHRGGRRLWRAVAPCGPMTGRGRRQEVNRQRRR